MAYKNVMPDAPERILAIVIGCLICSVILGLQGHDVLAGSIVTIIAAVATIFVLHKDPSHDNNSEKE